MYILCGEFILNSLIVLHNSNAYMKRMSQIAASGHDWVI